MPVAQTIEKKLSALAPSHLHVDNESHKHSVPENSETHFRVEIVSNEFNGVRAVQRHQAVYRLLQEEMAGPIHALAIHAYTPDEWQGMAPTSPDCLGGSRTDN